LAVDEGEELFEHRIQLAVEEELPALALSS